ncbi:MAG: TrmH family RNA methyltransferase, partial [Anaerolineae bacterium]
RVRRVLALQRSTRHRVRENLMVAEGARLVAELNGSGIEPVEVFVTEAFYEADAASHDLVQSLDARTTVIQVSDELMAEMSDTVTPQGILAVLPIPDLTPSAVERFVLVPDQVRDPGNLGTMLRTAWAAGVTEVLLPPGTVDPTNPKVVRAGMGAHFYLPIHGGDWDQIWEAVGPAQVWLAEARKGQRYDAADWTGDVALVIGGEAAGAGRVARRVADFVHIPMAAGVESLNAAAAAAILLFEAARQRRHAHT